MGLFSFGRSKQELLAGRTARLRKLESESTQRQGQLEELRELGRHLDGDRSLLVEALGVLRPGMTPKDLAAALLELCFKPLSLASFYLALVDWEQDLIHFPLYHEGGRVRNVSWRFTGTEGLTGRALHQGRPLYFRTLEESMDGGAMLTEAEKLSGLVPPSWYGVPLGCGPEWGVRPFGLLSFQSFQKDAFSESQRNLMDALSNILAYAMKSDPGRPIVD